MSKKTEKTIEQQKVVGTPSWEHYQELLKRREELKGTLTKLPYRALEEKNKKKN